MKIKYISWIPAALMMIIIFSFSAKQAESSNETSLMVAGRALSVYEKVTGTEYAGNERAKMLDTINHVVRKGAHFCEYALLACTFALHLLVLKKRGKMLLFIPVTLSALYASTDELHQLLVSGRSCQLSDIFLDTCGALTGSLIFTAIVFLSAKSRRKAGIQATEE